LKSALQFVHALARDFRRIRRHHDLAIEVVRDPGFALAKRDLRLVHARDGVLRVHASINRRASS
jgi:hypothetical protein